MSARPNRVLARFVPAAVAGLALLVPASPCAAAGDLWIVALEPPARSTLEKLAALPNVDVRWVERGLVLCEVEDPAALQDLEPRRVLARRDPGTELGLLRGAERFAWSKAAAQPAEVAAFVRRSHVADARATAGDVMVLVATASEWPADLRGCHGGLILPAHHVDPRSLIDAGPPSALARFLERPARPPSARGRAALAAVSTDSLRAHEDLLTLHPLGQPADRYVFDTDLEGIYLARTRATMQRALAGIPGAQVFEQRFYASQAPRADSTDNVIARLPGAVPGTGTFVVCAHVDATGIRDAAWRAAVDAGQPVQTPGGEDNASGVACVLEVLRCLAEARRAGGARFAFDVEFIAFSAEEIGLQGSDYYVRQAAAAASPLLGTFNFDMVGYQRPAGNLQLVYNDASRWLVDVLQAAAPALVPPSPLHLTAELDEARASDHNSFWTVNGPAILLADATIDSLRAYETYHKPIDFGSLVDIAKMADVSRLLLAGLLRFDTDAAPELAFGPPDFELLREVQGIDVVYRPGYHRLFPGAVLEASMVVRSAGGEFRGPLHATLSTQGAGGVRTLLDSLSTPTLPTLAQWKLVYPVPIAATDGGWNRITARISYPDSAGQQVVRAVTDSFLVDVTTQPPLSIVLNPNPVRGDPHATVLEIRTLNLPGTLQIEIFDLEGQRIGTSSRDVTPPPLVTGAKYWVNLLEGSGVPADLASGTYLVRVHWQGASDAETAVVPWAVIR